MIDYSKWPSKKVMVTSLKLDDQNPRLPGVSTSKVPTQPQIIDYLVAHELVYDLAKSIVTQGYLLNENPIVCKEGNKFVVLEGNRRVAACKLIINTDLIKSKIKKKSLDELIKNFDLNIIKKLEVKIAPNREAADILIVNRHTEGSVIEKWDKTKQDRFFYNRIIGGEGINELSIKFNLKKSAIKDALIRHNMYSELLTLDLTTAEKKNVEDETKFAMTNIERFYKSKLGKEFLGVEFDDKGKIVHLFPKAEYNKRLKKVTSDVISNVLNSRTYGDEKLQRKYVDELNLSTDFNFSLTPNKAFDKEYFDGIDKELVEETPPVKQDVVIKPTIKETPSNKLIPLDCVWITSNERIDKIFKELKAANLDIQFNSAAILFRSYLDMLVYQFLLKEDGIKTILIEEQKKLDLENSRRLERIVNFFTGLGIKSTLIIEKDLIKAIGGRTGISKDWIPSLKQMLVYISKSQELLPDARLRQALTSYVKGNDSYLDHNDFNLLVHNEYFTKGSISLKEVWQQIYPLLNYINQQLSK